MNKTLFMDLNLKDKATTIDYGDFRYKLGRKYLYRFNMFDKTVKKVRLTDDLKTLFVEFKIKPSDTILIKLSRSFIANLYGLNLVESYDNSKKFKEI